MFNVIRSKLSGTTLYTTWTTARHIGNFKKPTITTLKREGLKSLKSIFQEDKRLSSVDWRNLRDKILTCERHITEVNVDAVILGHCDTHSKLDFAKDYIAFLQEDGIEPNYATWGRLMKLYYRSFKSGMLSESDKEDILEFYHKLRKRHEFLDPTTCENMIFALCTTKEWKDSFELLEMIKQLGTPTIHTYGVIIEKCFETVDNIPRGWTLLEEMLAKDKQPHCGIFINYFKVIQEDTGNFTENLEKMLNFIGENGIVVTQLVINELQTILDKMRIKSFVTQVSEAGKCKKCGQKMKNVSLSTDEFNELSSVFLNQVLIRKDVFLKTTPKELQEFLQFVDKTGPYDCVVDGLNVAFSAGTKKSPTFFVKMLTSIVNYFKKQKKEILVIGRKHMSSWPEREMSYIKRNANLYLTSNLTHDDPFLLYATLKSGIATDFCSRDLMRSHLFLLDNKLKNVFRRWQQIHQYSLIYVYDNGNVSIKEPTKFHINAHKLDKTWHVPFKEEFLPKPGLSYEVPDKWLCFNL